MGNGKNCADAEKPAAPLEMVKGEEASCMRGETCPRNCNMLLAIQHLKLP